MVPTSVFPNLERLYPGSKIVCIKAAWKIGFGWSLNIYSKLPVIAQLRKLKEQGFTKVTLILRKETEFQSNWNIAELTFYKTLNRIPPMIFPWHRTPEKSLETPSHSLTF